MKSNRYREYSAHSAWPITINPPAAPSYSRLSVVIAFYNKGDMTADCVDSIQAQMPDCEVILVDNGSSPETKEVIHRRLSDRVKLILFDDNRGCPIAWNAGLESATGDLLAVMNNDIVANDGGIKQLSDSAWRVGISCFLSGKLGPDLMFSGRSRTSNGTSYPEGSALFFRRDVWEDVGIFDEGMILAYCEDSDWGLRARLKGYSWETCPDSLVHFGQATSSTVEHTSWFLNHNQDRLRLKFSDLGIGERIAVKCASSVSKAVMATPALEGLRRDKPLALIQLVTSPEIAEYSRGLDFIDSAVTEAAPDCTQFFDLDEADENQENMSVWRHPAYNYAEILGVSLSPEPYAVPDTEHLRTWARATLGQSMTRTRIALVPRDSTESRAQWAETKWLELCRLNPDLEFIVLDSFGKPRLDDREKPLAQDRLWDQPNVIYLGGQTLSLLHATAILRECQGCIAVDTGLGHIATGLGLPTVMLFGGTPTWTRAPLAGKYRLIQGEAPRCSCECAGLGSDHGGPDCLESIDPTLVSRSLHEVVAQAGPQTTGYRR